MEEKQIYNHLMEKYRANQLSQEEFQRFIELINQDGLEKDEVLDDLAQKDWVSSENILKQIEKEEQRIARRMRFRRWNWNSAAAVVVLCLAWYLWPNPATEVLVFETGFGETQNIELPDGSKVLLNANSSLTWQSEWKQTGQRQVVLDGEAYFDVTKVKGVPFEVAASDIRVHVVGTEFNVRNREMESEVFLHEGKVDLRIDSDASRKVEMKPGDFVRYDKQEHSVSHTEHEQMDKKAAWVDGMLEFENKKVELILKDFRDLYGKEFRIENSEIANKRMDLSLPYADWELVRKALEIAIGAEFTESQDTIIVK